jgi:hypothetical protein
MRLTNIVWTTVIIAAAIILTAVLSTASIQAAGQAAEATAPVAPRFLSETGLYSNVATLDVDSRNRTFSQYGLWSDGAAKHRWVRLPVGSQIDVADLGKWELPVGTKFWKEVSFKGRRVETHFLWQTAKNKWVFASYTWNDAQTDAELASETGIADIAQLADGKSTAPRR